MLLRLFILHVPVTCPPSTFDTFLHELLLSLTLSPFRNRLHSVMYLMCHHVESSFTHVYIPTHCVTT